MVREAPFLLPRAPTPRLLCPLNPSGGAWKESPTLWVSLLSLSASSCSLLPQALLPAHPPLSGHRNSPFCPNPLREDRAAWQPASRGRQGAGHPRCRDARTSSWPNVLTPQRASGGRACALCFQEWGIWGTERSRLFPPSHRGEQGARSHTQCRGPGRLTNVGEG